MRQKVSQGNRMQKLKTEVLVHYGINNVLACVRCGFNDVDALTIDHINGNGNRHRKELGNRAGVSFYYWLVNNNYPEGYQALCMNCQFIKAREQYTLNKSYKDTIVKFDDRRKISQDMFPSRKEYMREYLKEYRKTGKYKSIISLEKENRIRRKAEVLSHYGNGECTCIKCGYDDIRALSIDHINGNGTEHRDNIKESIYAWLKRNNYPNGYQTLCMNCQFIKKITNKEYSNKR